MIAVLNRRGSHRVFLVAFSNNLKKPKFLFGTFWALGTVFSLFYGDKRVTGIWHFWGFKGIIMG